ncbi:peptide deformylase [Acetobacter aceti NBRC 14818]|uniref:Peptide deformylase-like n=1 Tax=Acetobacter aceti NBRC 14818 TaxID=887700 RepID=A0AB33IEJ1_ACEAC|nr:peptide deformylase [Acetobacter aceti]TCS34063.1 peptide deformylase [Acetobacter aceti NBRC 14818]BCK75647.1 peptide deformylase-like protein [Acetobacter aceti NBRC 14818]GAN56590.1 peptide deformylase [Acetobacter aceti NBRC 14818]
MALRQIVMFPDQRLRLVADSVTYFDETLRSLATDLLDTMRAAPGIGITAPHIGVAQRVVVLELPDAPGPQTYINPEIIEASKETIRLDEGSISMPGVTGTVERSARVRVRYQDLEGTEHVEEAEGLRAACHQHEIDQLNGLFWTQRLSPLRRGKVMAQFEKLRRR